MRHAVSASQLALLAAVRVMRGPVLVDVVLVTVALQQQMLRVWVDLRLAPLALLKAVAVGASAAPALAARSPACARNSAATEFAKNAMAVFAAEGCQLRYAHRRLGAEVQPKGL